MSTTKTETPVDEAWLRSVSTSEMRPGPLEDADNRRFLIERLTFEGVSGDTLWSVSFMGHELNPARTRGQVRTLCKGLGIALKESES